MHSKPHSCSLCSCERVFECDISSVQVGLGNCFVTNVCGPARRTGQSLHRSTIGTCSSARETRGTVDDQLMVRKRTDTSRAEAGWGETCLKCQWQVN